MNAFTICMLLAVTMVTHSVNEMEPTEPSNEQTTVIPPHPWQQNMLEYVLISHPEWIWAEPEKTQIVDANNTNVNVTCRSAAVDQAKHAFICYMAKNPIPEFTLGIKDSVLQTELARMSIHGYLDYKENPYDPRQLFIYRENPGFEGRVLEFWSTAQLYAAWDWMKKGCPLERSAYSFCSKDSKKYSKRINPLLAPAMLAEVAALKQRKKRLKSDTIAFISLMPEQLKASLIAFIKSSRK